MRCVFFFLYFFIGSHLLSAQNFNAYEWVVFDTTNSGLESNYIVDFYFLEDGSAYVSTSPAGLYFYRDGRFSKVKLPENISYNWLTGLTMDSEGNLYISGSPNDVLIYNTIRESWERIEIPGFAMHMLRNEAGVLLLGMHLGHTVGLYQYAGGVLTELESNRYQDVMGMILAPNGDAVVGFRGGFYRYPMQPDGTYGPSTDEISDMAFYDFGFDSGGTLWATSFITLQLHSRDSLGHWTMYDGGPEALKTDWNGERKYIAHKLVVLPDDRIVIGVQTHCGIGVFDGKNWQAYMVPGLEDRFGIQEVKLAPDGSIWCATPYSGLLIFRPQAR
ncbi:MAG: hypothetical protein KDC34_20235 [Saprospiraceae bacterium]|nr:hypothetical protein [Saprospiraceae bacterium]